MGAHEYYENMKALAREVRTRYGVRTDALGLSEMRRIYRLEGITIDFWPYKLRKVRAAYLIHDGVPHVLINKSMKPIEPRLFSMAHELKHHYADRNLAMKAPLGCRIDFSDRGLPVIEIGAEVFAAEFIFPESEFRAWVQDGLGDHHCTAEKVVHLKRVCPAKVSYTYLVKRLTRLGYVSLGAFTDVQFTKLEERLFGLPFYKRFKNPRGRRQGTGRL